MSFLKFITHTNCPKFEAYIDAKYVSYRRLQILVVKERTLSYSLNASVNTIKNTSKLCNIGEFFWNNGTNQDKAWFKSKVPTKPTQDTSVEYRWSWSKVVSLTWFIKHQTFLKGWSLFLLLLLLSDHCLEWMHLLCLK